MAGVHGATTSAPINCAVASIRAWPWPCSVNGGYSQLSCKNPEEQAGSFVGSDGMEEMPLRHFFICF